MIENHMRSVRMQNTISQTGTGRATQLQFLRFLAFMNVFIFHAESWNFFGYPAHNGGRIAVSFFFCLSGLVTGYSGFGKDVKLNPREIGRHMARKIGKIYPLYLLSMLIPLIHSGVPELIAEGNWQALGEEMTLLGRNLLLIQSWFQEGYFHLNGVGWFLSSLVFLNLFDLPGIYLLNRGQKSEKRYILFGGAAFCILMLTMLYCGLTRGLNRGFWHYIFPPARLGEYLLGMILGFAARPLAQRISRNKRNTYLFTALELGVMGLWWLFLPTTGPYWLRSSVYWLLPNLALLGVFALGKGAVSDLFRWKPLVWLGDISFECFLFHGMIVARYEINHGWAIASPLDQAVAFFFCLAVTLLAASLLHKAKK